MPRAASPTRASALGRVAVGHHEATADSDQRGPSSSSVAQVVAEPLGHLAEEASVVQRQDGTAEAIVERPDDRAAVAGHRQARERPVREEALHREPAVRPRVATVQTIPVWP